MSAPIAVRIWAGARVVLVITAHPDGSYSTFGQTGGAGNSTQVDIELDPWAQLVTDNRAEHPHPVSIREKPEY